MSQKSEPASTESAGTTAEKMRTRSKKQSTAPERRSSRLELDEVIDMFRAVQEHVTFRLRNSGIPLPSSAMQWAVAISPAIREGLFSIPTDMNIRPHGFGIEFYDSRWWIDFDFGLEGQLGGFDAWRIQEFIENNALNALDTKSESIQQLLEAGVKKRKYEQSRHINYYQLK